MLLGITLGGRFRVSSRFAQTSLGVVYRAQDLEEQRSVLVRTLHPRYRDQERMVEQFHRQAETIGQLENEHTARVLCEVTDPGVVGYVTEMLGGETLAHLLEVEQKLEQVRGLRIARQIAESLAEAHAKGVVHRNLEPANVLVRTDDFGIDHVKVHGYGLATIREHSTVASTQRADQAPYYIAPEQMRRHKPSRAMDLYALGTVLFETISGRRPFDDPDPMTVLRMKATLRPPSLREASTDADKAVVTLVNGLLVSDPGGRKPATAAEVANRLAELLEKLCGERVSRVDHSRMRSIVETIPRPGRSKREGRRASPILWGAALGVLLGGAIAAVDLVGEDVPPPPPRDAVIAAAAVPATSPTQPAHAARAPAAKPARPAAPRPAPAAAEEPARPAAEDPTAVPAAGEVPKPVGVAPPATKPGPAPATLEAAPSPRAVPARPAEPSKPLAPTGMTAELVLGHRGVVRVSAWARDGSVVVTGADDRMVHVTDATTGLRRSTLVGLESTPTAVAVSADGRMVVAGTLDGALHAWVDGRSVGEVRRMRGGIRVLRFANGGKHLLTVDRSRQLNRIAVDGWRNAGRVVRLGRGGPSFSTALSGDGGRIVVVNAGEDRHVVPRDTTTGRVPIEVDALPDVIATAMDDSGEWAVTGSSRGRMQILRLGDATSESQLDHGSPLTALAVHPSQRLLASGGSHGKVKVWSLDTARQRGKTHQLGESAITHLVFSPVDGTLVASGADFRTHTIDSGAGVVRNVVVGVPTGGAPRLAFAPGSTRLAMAGQDDSVHIWDLVRGVRSERVTGLTDPRCITFAPDGRVLVATGDGHLMLLDGEKRVWDLDVGDTFMDLAVDAQYIVAASSSVGSARWFDLEDGKEHDAPIGTARDRLRTVALSPTGSLLAAGNSQGAVLTYQLEGDRVLRPRRLLPGRGLVLDLAWRPDGRVLAAAFERGGLLVYHLGRRGRPPALQRSGMTPLPAILLSGSELVAGAADGSIRRWDYEKVSPLSATEAGPGSPRWAIAADGRLYAASDHDGRVRLGRIGSGEASVWFWAAGDAWVAWRSDGRYTGNAAGAGMLRVRTDDGLKAVTSFSDLRSDAAIAQALSSSR